MLIIFTCGCPTNGELLAQITPSRVEGVAPLPVFFDALTSKLSDYDEHAAYYLWDFGDPESAHPMATGFCAAHVYENPGVYTVLLRVVDGNGYASQASVQINVQPFGGKTFHVSSSEGNDGNDGLTPASALASFDAAMVKADAALYGGAAGGVRVLFKRGDFFATAKGKDWTKAFSANPLIFAAYGEGERPVIHNDNAPCATFTSIRSVSGIRWVDLNFTGNFEMAKDPTGYECASKPAMRFLDGNDRCVLRCKFDGMANPWLEVGTAVAKRTDIFMVDSEAYDCWNTTFLGGRRLAVIGNRLERTSFEHILRVWMADKGVISQNQFYDPSINSALGRHALKLHSAMHDPMYNTNHVIVSDNIFRGSVWPVTIAPQDAYKPEVVEDVVFERNVVVEDYFSTMPTQQALLISARDVTVRNNIFTGATRRSHYFAVRVLEYNCGGVVPQNIRVFNNTMAHGFDESATSVFLYLDGANVSGVHAANNLLYSPMANSASCMFYFANGAKVNNVMAHNNLAHSPNSSTFVIDNGTRMKLADWQALGQGAGSLMADPMLLGAKNFNYKPATGSCVAGKGAQVAGVRDDFERLIRPFNTACAIGAIEP